MKFLLTKPSSGGGMLIYMQYNHIREQRDAQIVSRYLLKYYFDYSARLFVNLRIKLFTVKNDLKY